MESHKNRIRMEFGSEKMDMVQIPGILKENT
jgi:hypothetical protein